MTDQPQPTIVDVARAAGVSPATVSRALHRNHTTAPVAEATSQLIIEAAIKVGYRRRRRAPRVKARYYVVARPGRLHEDLGRFHPTTTQIAATELRDGLNSKSRANGLSGDYRVYGLIEVE